MVNQIKGFLLLIFLLSIPVGVYAVQARGLKFEKTLHDFGEVKNGNSYEYLFKFKNEGKNSVTVKDIITSCGCTAVALSGKKLFKNGESGKIKVVYTPAGDYRDISFAVKVFTDRLKQPYILFIKASRKVTKVKKEKRVVSLTPTIIFSPKVVNIGKMKVGETAIYKVIIENKGRGELHVTNFDAENEKSGLPLSKKPIKRGEKIELSAFYKAHKIGAINGFLTIKSNDPVNPIVRVYLKGAVKVGKAVSGSANAGAVAKDAVDSSGVTESAKQKAEEELKEN